MEIKVGEYVRTDNGICKIINNADKYVKDYQVSVDYIGGMYSQVINKDRILKCSKNIIDLIEVGDYVNRKEIHEIDEQRKRLYSYERDDYHIFNERDIQRVVTHEQMERMEYKV